MARIGGPRGRHARKSICFVGLIFLLAVCLRLWVHAASVNADLAPHDPAVRIAPATSFVGIGEVFSVEVVISDAMDLGAYQFEMDFDPAVVRARDVEDASFLGSTGRTPIAIINKIDNTEGTLAFGVISIGTDPGPSGMGVLATITLEAQGGGSTALHLFNVKASDTKPAEQPVTVEDGVVIVGGQRVYLPIVMKNASQ